MKINSFTNYAFRILIMLGASPNRTVSLKQIATAYDISLNHLKKVAGPLIEHGLIETSRGRSGGIRLAKPIEEVNLGAVFRISQTDTAFVECLTEADDGCVISPVCRLQRIFVSALGQFLAVMDGYTLADLMQNKEQLIPLLGLDSDAEQISADVIPLKRTKAARQ